MDKLKLWIKKTKFKLFKKEREKYNKTDTHYYRRYDKPEYSKATMFLSRFIPFKLFLTYNASSQTYYAYWDKDGYLCEEDTQGYHNSKL